MVIIGLLSVYPTLSLKVIDVVTLFKLGSVMVIIVIGAVQLCKGETSTGSVTLFYRCSTTDNSLSARPFFIAHYCHVPQDIQRILQ